MNPDQAQQTAERDQLWASLRALRADIDQIAQGNFEPTERHAKIVLLLSRIVLAELDFRAQNAD